MKLAEALMLRADAQKRLEQMKQRILRNAKVQEGDSPAEEPNVLLAEGERIAAELLSLIQRINNTNANSRIESGETISDAIAMRDILKIRQSLFRELSVASMVLERYSRAEIKFVSTVDVADIQKQADALAKECRDLDVQIQSANWKIDLLD